MASELEQLAKISVIVADTGDIDAIRKHKPVDATTNPSLLFKAAQQAQYQNLVDDAIAYAKKFKASEQLEEAMDRLAVNFGVEILKIVPGVVSTEVDARLSFETEKSMAKARKLIGMYKDAGVPKERILIKLASTWQGIKAAEKLEKEGIATNLTLLFNAEAQAVACAEAKVTLISPFVGRTSDWAKKHYGKDFKPEEDPGCKLIHAIHKYFQKYGYKTIVMGASFRTKGQIIEIAGCEKLTISPNLIQELAEAKTPIQRKLKPLDGKGESPPPPLNESTFYMRMCMDPMAIEKLHDGIRGFVADAEKLEAIIRTKLGQAKL
jgi:transaldolase